MVDNDHISITALLTNKGDGAIGGGMDGCARGRGIVDTFMACPFPVDRMLAHAELGADACEFQCRFKKCTLQAAAFKIVVAPSAVGRFEPDSTMRLAAVSEFHGKDAASAAVVAIMRMGFVDDSKIIALAQVFHEI